MKIVVANLTENRYSPIHMKTLLSTCPRCAGLGKVQIPGFLKECLRLVRKTGEVSAQDVQAMATDILTINAFNNRLERLRDMGLVGRRREGKTFLYHAK